MGAGASAARAPWKATIWRVVTDADAEVFGAVVGRWLMSRQAAGEGQGAGLQDRGLVPVRLDGKTVRGACDAEGNQRHLLAALAGPAGQAPVVAAQAEVGAKTNEVPMAVGVLGQIDLHGNVVTADALHTVKENRQALFDALDALPWDQVPVACSANDRGHGRVTTRTIQVNARGGGSAVPARQPGAPDRTLRQRPGREPRLGRCPARRPQPRAAPGTS